MDDLKTIEEIIGYTRPTSLRNFIPCGFAGGLGAALEARRRVVNEEKPKSTYEQGIVRLYDPIGGSFGMTAKKFADMIDAQEGDFLLAINSPGGALFEGMAMANTLRRYDRGTVKAEVDGMAASAATLVANGADEIAATPETRYLVHRVQMMAEGTGSDFEAYVEEARELDAALARMYAQRSGGALTEDEAYALMDKDKILSAEKALEHGLIDRVIDGRGKEPARASNRVNHLRRVFDVFGQDFLKEE